jgi:uncharacterized protein YwbE
MYLTVNTDNQVKVAAEGGVSAVVTAMENHPTDAKVQAAACAALRNLAVNADNQVKVAAECGVGAVVTALQRHPTDAKVQEAACSALGNLALNNADNQVKVAGEGCVGAIVTALQNHPTHVKVQEAACLALASLTANSNNQVKAKSAGAEDAVKRTITLQDATALTKEWGQIVLDSLAAKERLGVSVSV